MKLPRKIKIGAQHFRIVRREEEADAPSNCYGWISPSRQVIYVSPAAGDEFIADTLLHEVLHAIVSVSGVTKATELGDEGLVAILNPWLVQVLRENPDLVRCLVGEVTSV